MTDNVPVTCRTFPNAPVIDDCLNDDKNNPTLPSPTSMIEQAQNLNFCSLDHFRLLEFCFSVQHSINTFQNGLQKTPSGNLEQDVSKFNIQLLSLICTFLKADGMSIYDVVPQMGYGGFILPIRYFFNPEMPNEKFERIMNFLHKNPPRSNSETLVGFAVYYPYHLDEIKEHLNRDELVELSGLNIPRFFGERNQSFWHIGDLTADDFPKQLLSVVEKFNQPVGDCDTDLPIGSMIIMVSYEGGVPKRVFQIVRNKKRKEGVLVSEPFSYEEQQAALSLMLFLPQFYSNNTRVIASSGVLNEPAPITSNLGSPKTQPIDNWEFTKKVLQLQGKARGENTSDFVDAMKDFAQDVRDEKI